MNLRNHKQKEKLGDDQYNEINAEAKRGHRDKLRSKLGTEEHDKQQAEYMKEYRAIPLLT
jgi:hypothetical protein